MQYVGQTGLSLKTRFRELLPNMKKPKTSDTFLYRHFKSNGHLPSKIVIQSVEKIITNISKKPDFDCVFFVCKSRSHGKRKNDNIKRKICTEKRLNNSLKDLSIALRNHGQHGLFSFKVPCLSQFYVI